MRIRSWRSSSSARRNNLPGRDFILQILARRWRGQLDKKSVNTTLMFFDTLAAQYARLRRCRRGRRKSVRYYDIRAAGFPLRKALWRYTGMVLYHTPKGWP